MTATTPEGLGYTPADVRRLHEMAGGAKLEAPVDIRRIIDKFDYLDDWRANYRIQSVRASLRADRITCIDAAILSYGLLELLFPATKRRLLAIHRPDEYALAAAESRLRIVGQGGHEGADPFYNEGSLAWAGF